MYKHVCMCTYVNLCIIVKFSRDSKTFHASVLYLNSYKGCAGYLDFFNIRFDTGNLNYPAKESIFPNPNLFILNLLAKVFYKSKYLSVENGMG